MQAFQQWCHSIRSGSKKEPCEVLSKVIASSTDSYGIATSLSLMLQIGAVNNNEHSKNPKSGSLLQSSSSSKSGNGMENGINTNTQFHFILLDLIMYEDKTLVAEALNLLMVKISC